uniref:Lysosome-associated membrane glycoprotein 2-like luminal domain-containing protein n=1 Tax=Branchiostoma floridae TaxID=7739 RepID=C3YL88_BRAFL|eukprot:XP_002602946.1 hypothetical protein BRAFLDRAFT_107797 [Branchiostoma floridae]
MTHFWLNEVVSVHTLSPGIFPDAKFPNVPVHTYNIGNYLNTSAFLSPRSYLCRRDKEFSLDQYVEELPTSVTIHYIHVQPFLVQHGGKFSQTEECPQDFQSTTEPPYPVTTDTLVIPVGHFVLHDDKGQVCLLANFGALFRVEYELIQGMTRNATYVLPENCAISGSCEEGTVHVTFSFDTAFNLSASFSSNEKTFKLVSLSVGYIRSADHFPHALYPDTSDIEELTNLTLWETDAGKSYLCKEPGVIKVGPHVTLEVLELQIQPFDVKNGTFGEANECNKDHSSTIAPFPTIVPASSILPTNRTHTTTNMPTLPPPVGPIEPLQGNYTVHDSEGKVCLLADMGLQLRINYTKQNGQIATGVVNVPVNSEVSENCTVSGFCEEETANVTLSFDTAFNLSASFSSDDKTFKLVSLSVGYTRSTDLFPHALYPNTSNIEELTNLTLLETNAGKSYLCKEPGVIKVGPHVTLEVLELQIQPFDVKNGTFGEANECNKDHSSTIAPFPTNACFTIVPASSILPTNGTHTTTNMPTLPPPVGPTEPLQGNYTVHDSEGKVCLLADMGLQLRINYTKQNGQIATGVVNVPVNSEVSDASSSTSTVPLLVPCFLRNEVFSLGILYPERGSWRGFNGNFEVLLNFCRDAPVMTHFWLDEVVSVHTLSPGLFPDAKFNNVTVTTYRSGIYLKTSSFMSPRSYLARKTNYFIWINHSETATVTFSFDTVFNLSASFSSDDKTFKLVSLSVGYTRSAKHFPDATYPDTSDIEELTNLTLLETDAGKSYLCKEPEVIKVGPHVTLEVLELQIQPFDVKNGTFGDANECNKDHSSTIAPFPTNASFTIVPASSILPTNGTHTTTNMPTLPPPIGPTEPLQGNYTVHDSEGKVCLLADMGLQLRVNYTKQSGQIATGVVNVPVNSEVSGKYSESHSSLTLAFYDATFNLTISFAMHKKRLGPRHLSVDWPLPLICRSALYLSGNATSKQAETDI